MQCSSRTPAHPHAGQWGRDILWTANGAELHGEFEDAVLVAATRIATGVFLFLDEKGRFEEGKRQPRFRGDAGPVWAL